jgi:integrase
MPLKLVPPRAGKTPYWSGRGTHHGRYIDRSTKARERRLALRLIRQWEKVIERGIFADDSEPTFASASIDYMNAGGERRFLTPLIEHFGTIPLRNIDQAAIDGAAVTLYPAETPATRNRQVYSPVSAILKHAGIEKSLKRPKGARGTRRTTWLQPEQAFALVASAHTLNPRFGALCTFLLYTGCRLSEALRLRPEDIDLPANFAYVRKTKNGEPRPVHLPPVLVSALANIEFAHATAFGYSKAGRIYTLLDDAATAAEVIIPDRVAFHIFRHCYGAWMRRYGGLDTSGLVGTGAWKSHDAARVYEHVDVSEEARKADLLPTATSIKKRTWNPLATAHKSLRSRRSPLPSHGRGHRFNPCRAHHHKRLNLLGFFR